MGRRSAHLSRPRAGGRRQGSDSDSRGHQRRRPPRPPEGIHRQPEPRERHRDRVRRRVGRGGAVPALHPAGRDDGPAGGRAAGDARWLGLPGHPRGPEHVHLGTRRLALRHARGVHEFERGSSWRARCRARAHERRRLAVSSEITPLRGVRRGHEQPVGARFQRLRARVHDRLRDRAPLSTNPRREVQAPGRAALQPERVRRHQDDRQSRALGRESRDRTRATADPDPPAAATPTPAR